MIIEVPVCGPQAHLRSLYGGGGQCLGGCNSLQCADMHSRGKMSIRVRCRHDAQGRVCPELHVCTLEHWLPLNTDRFEWILGESSRSMACFERRVGVWEGNKGRGWAYQHGLFRGGVRLQRQQQRSVHTGPSWGGSVAVETCRWDQKEWTKTSCWFRELWGCHNDAWDS